MDPNTVYRPGPWFYLAGIATVLSGLVIGSLPSQTFGTAWVWLAGGVLAFVWFVAFVICANESKLAIRRVHWARWAGIPALGVLFVAISATNLPVETRFGLSRGALDQAAASARAGMATGHGWVGLIPVDWVRAYPDGVVIAQVTGSGGCGFANFSGRWPALNASVDGAGGAPLLPLDGDWWTWCHYQSFD